MLKRPYRAIGNIGKNVQAYMTSMKLNNTLSIDKPNGNPRSIVIHVEHADNMAQTISPPTHPKGRLYV